MEASTSLYLAVLTIWGQLVSIFDNNYLNSSFFYKKKNVLKVAKFIKIHIGTGTSPNLAILTI